MHTRNIDIHFNFCFSLTFRFLSVGLAEVFLFLIFVLLGGGDEIFAFVGISHYWVMARVVRQGFLVFPFGFSFWFFFSRFFPLVAL